VDIFAELWEGQEPSMEILMSRWL